MRQIVLFLILGMAQFVLPVAHANDAKQPEVKKGWLPKTADTETVLFRLNTQRNCQRPDEGISTKCSAIDVIYWYKNKINQPLPTFTHPIAESSLEAKRFAEAFFSHGKTYWLATNNSAHGVEIDQPELLSCASLSASLQPSERFDVLLRPDGAVSDVVLRSAVFAKPSPSWQKHLDKIKKAATKDFTERAKGKDASVLQITKQHAIQNQDGIEQWLAVEIAGDVPPTEPDCQTPGCDNMTHFYRSFWLWDMQRSQAIDSVQYYRDASYYGKSLIDAVDLDGDLVPELIFETRLYEVNEYEIYKIKGNELQLVYRGGGYGC